MANTLRTMIVTQLERQQRDGTQRLPIDDSARAILRQWMIAARKGQIAPPSYSIEQEPESPSAPPATPQLKGKGETPAEQLGNLYSQLNLWSQNQDLSNLRKQLIHGQGITTPDILFLGDTPGANEESANKPFAGAAGDKLNGMLTAMGLSRESIFLCYAVPFRPHSPDQAALTRPPSTHELTACREITLAEIEILRPKVIIVLGAIAARALLQEGELPLSAYRKEKLSVLGIPVIVTHHPSYLLRTNDLKERRSIWEDMLQAMRIAGLPISSKQESYFLPKTTS